MPDKTSLVLYHDMRGPLELLDDADRGKLFLAILDYSEWGTEPDFTGALGMCFAFVKTAIDRDAAAWEAKREKRREAGSIGGKQSQANRANACFASRDEGGQANQAVPVPVPAPVSVSVPVPEKENMADKPPRASRFSPPSVDEVRAYCQERGNRVDPERFVDFYSAKGWRIGNQTMKDWQAAVRTWEGRDKGAKPAVRDYSQGEGGLDWSS